MRQAWRGHTGPTDNRRALLLSPCTLPAHASRARATAVWPLAAALAGLAARGTGKGVTSVDLSILVVLALLVLAAVLVWLFSKVEARTQ